MDVNPGGSRADDGMVRAASANSGSERRLKHRFETHDLASALGRVVDISRTGARVICDGAPPVKGGQTVSIRLVVGGKKLVLSAEVVRIRRPKIMGKERSIGLKFVGLSRKHEVALENLGRYGTFIPGADQSGEFAGSETTSQSTAYGDPTQSQAPPPDATIAIELPDLYAILGAPPESSHEELRAAFRKLATKLHPDVNPDPEAHEQFQEVVSAWQILGDADLRALFDKRRERAA